MLDASIFVLTIPKSGTHLIANLFRSILGGENVSPNMFGQAELDQCLHNAATGRSPGGIIHDRRIHVGHIPWTPDYASLLRPYRKVLLVRDPRDVVISLARSFFSRKAGHLAAEDFIRKGASLGEVISMCIAGCGTIEPSVESIVSAFEKYHFRWLDQSAFVVRYEDINRSFSAPKVAAKTIIPMLEALGLPSSKADIIHRIRNGGDPARSATFDKGESEQWKKTFSRNHRNLFRSLAPTLTVTLGYEEDGQTGISQSGLVTSGERGTRSKRTGPNASEQQLLQGDTLSTLTERVRRLQSLDEHVHERISLLQCPDWNIWMLVWTADFTHLKLAQDYVNDALFQKAIAGNAPDGSRLPNVRLPKDFMQPVTELLRPHLARGLKVHFVDVGAGYGVEDVLVSAALHQFSNSLRITAIEPGPAGELAPFNFRLNACEHKIHFLNQAVTHHDKFALVYGEYGHLENVRTVNRSATMETFSYPLESVRLDSIISEKPDGEMLFLKIDISGGELHALRGAADTLARLADGIILKVIPHALAPYGNAEDLLSLIPERFQIFDIGFYSLTRKKGPVRKIARSEFAEFYRHLFSAAKDYSNLLLLPEQAVPPTAFS